MNALRLFGLYILFTKLYASVSPHGTRLANSSGRGQPRPTVPAGRGQTGLRSDESRVSPESVLTNSLHGVASGVWSRVRRPVDRRFDEGTFLAREWPWFLFAPGLRDGPPAAKCSAHGRAAEADSTCRGPNRRGRSRHQFTRRTQESPRIDRHRCRPAFAGRIPRAISHAVGKCA